MNPRDALSRTLAAVTNTVQCSRCRRRDERLERFETAYADQIRLNGRLATTAGDRDRKIRELQADRSRLTGIIITVLRLRGADQHELRRLRVDLAAANARCAALDERLDRLSVGAVAADSIAGFEPDASACASGGEAA